MILNLRLEYQTPYGQELYVVVGAEKEKSYAMQYLGDGVWGAELKLAAATELVYRYEVRYGSEVVRKEWGAKHSLVLDKKATEVRILDKWHAMPVDRSFHSSMFVDGVFHREKAKKVQAAAAGYLTIRADVAVVRSSQSLVLVGS
ncbi:MAG: hypothetical protein IKW42_00265, partial [Alistipes sp.]|nr:hypothetical protein [Alistipes sp.]